MRGWVRERKGRLGWPKVTAVIPLDPEVAQEGEVDWGGAWVRMGGADRAVKLFCMRWRYSGLAYVRAYPWERQEMFLEGHMRAFTFYGGVFPVLVYDNLTAAVRQILRGKARVEQQRFVAFRSYYTFQARYCNPARGREKGGVEGLVGYARRNFLVPIPEVDDFQQLNQLLEQRCWQDGQRRIQGRQESLTIEQRHQQEGPRLLPLPERPFENTRMMAVRISPYQTAQVDRNRYSVPTAYVGRWLWAHLGCERVSFYADRRQVAEHPRIFSNSQWQINPLHYLDLLYQRVGAFESARPIRQWRPNWPGHYETMLERLRHRYGDNGGTREFVGLLQLHQSYPAQQVEEAVAQALGCGTSSVESVRHLLRAQQCRTAEPAPLQADRIPGVTDRTVATSDVGCYDQLVGGER